MVFAFSESWFVLKYALCTCTQCSKLNLCPSWLQLEYEHYTSNCHFSPVEIALTELIVNKFVDGMVLIISSSSISPSASSLQSITDKP